jgi:hypothetical protein
MPGVSQRWKIHNDIGRFNKRSYLEKVCKSKFASKYEQPIDHITAVVTHFLIKTTSNIVPLLIYPLEKLKE